MKLLVRNLTRNTSEAELKAIFEPFGTIQSCTLVIDNDTKISKGFGFVEMPKVGEAKSAMKSLNGTNLLGSKIRVKKSESPAEKPAVADDSQAND